MKRLVSLLLLAGLLLMNGCKKDTCTFPFVQDGRGCYDTRNDFTGQYYGPIHQYSLNIGDQVVLRYVLLGGKNDNHLEIQGMDATFDEHANIKIDSQIIPYQGGKKYLVFGTGYFADTLKEKGDTVRNKMMVLDLDNVVVDTPGNSYFSHYVGFR